MPTGVSITFKHVESEDICMGSSACTNYESPIRTVTMGANSHPRVSTQYLAMISAVITVTEAIGRPSPVTKLKIFSGAAAEEARQASTVRLKPHVLDPFRLQRTPTDPGSHEATF